MQNGIDDIAHETTLTCRTRRRETMNIPYGYTSVKATIPFLNILSPNKKFILRLEIHIFNLKIHILSLKIHISKLKIEKETGYMILCVLPFLF